MATDILADIKLTSFPSGDRVIHIGRNVRTGEQVFVPLESFDLHSAIRGATGSQKSRLALYLMLQILFIEGGPLFLLDLGTDRFVFHVLRDFCRRLAKLFSFVSTSQRDAGKHFAPSHVLSLTDETLVLLINYYVTALSLHYGDSFGKGYYGDGNYSVYGDVLTGYIQDGNTNPDIEEIVRSLEVLAKDPANRDANHTQRALAQLLQYPQLFATGMPENDLNIPQQVQDGAVLVGFINGLLEIPGPKISGLLVWANVLAMMARVEQGLPPKQLTIVIDEFGVVAQSRSFQLLITLARKYHIRLMMLYQSEELLRGDTRGVDLRPLVRDNTGAKLYLTFTGDDIEDLQGMSRRVPRLKGGGHSKRGRTVSTQSRYEEGPEIEYNDVLDASGTAGQGFVIYNSGRGHEEPIRFAFEPIYFTEYFTLEVHSELSNTPLPKRTLPDWDTPRTIAGNDSAIRSERIIKLTELLFTLRAEEGV